MPAHSFQYAFYNGKRLFYAFDEKVEVKPRIHKLEIEEYWKMIT